ncbi:MAG: hypothetical protein ACO1NU_08665 [Arcticibacter sp.]
MNNAQKLTAWLNRIEHHLYNSVPTIIAETSTEYFKESFRTKSFNGVKWKETKRKVSRGSLMVRSGALVSTIKPSLVSSERVRISAGSSRVPYARVHNEGGLIRRASRSETFVRNRHTRGKKGKMFGGMGAFRKGTTPGQGLTFKAYEYRMPQRQFMGHSAILNKRIIMRIKGAFDIK